MTLSYMAYKRTIVSSSGKGNLAVGGCSGVRGACLCGPSSSFVSLLGSPMSIAHADQGRTQHLPLASRKAFTKTKAMIF